MEEAETGARARLAALRQERARWFDRLLLWRRRRLVDRTDGRVPQCERCQDHCCKAPHDVALRLDDTARLIDAGLGWAIAAPPPRRLPVYQEPMLAKRPDGTCVFFGADGRCQIYALRPIVCQRFPYAIGDDARTLTYSSSCRSHAGGDAAARRPLIDAAVNSYAARRSDLLLVRRARSALVALGLLPPDTRDRFAAALRKD